MKLMEEFIPSPFTSTNNRICDPAILQTAECKIIIYNAALHKYTWSTCVHFGEEVLELVEQVQKEIILHICIFNKDNIFFHYFCFTITQTIIYHQNKNLKQSFVHFFFFINLIWIQLQWFICRIKLYTICPFKHSFCSSTNQYKIVWDMLR